jgi:polyisoprenoid-binding protein YceI
VQGHFERYEGTLNLERSPAIELTIDAASINTNLALRDRHLRSADFFDVANYPEVRFVSDTATLRGETLTVRGRLYAAGRSIPLEFEGRLRHLGDELELEATTTADHRKLGMSHGTLGMIRTPSELIVRGRLVR